MNLVPPQWSSTSKLANSTSFCLFGCLINYMSIPRCVYIHNFLKLTGSRAPVGIHMCPPLLVRILDLMLENFHFYPRLISGALQFDRECLKANASKANSSSLRYPHLFGPVHKSKPRLVAIANFVDSPAKVWHLKLISCQAWCLFTFVHHCSS